MSENPGYSPFQASVALLKSQCSFERECHETESRYADWCSFYHKGATATTCVTAAIFAVPRILAETPTVLSSWGYFFHMGIAACIVGVPLIGEIFKFSDRFQFHMYRSGLYLRLEQEAGRLLEKSKPDYVSESEIRRRDSIAHQKELADSTARFPCSESVRNRVIENYPELKNQ